VKHQHTELCIHDKDHHHDEFCGHPRVQHGDHIDFLVGNHLHHIHGEHCDEHGYLYSANPESDVLSLDGEHL